ncbi:TPA: CatB-related O-acetyltransferase, partial [Escherichia coli]|nr:CatB-related O-acetyltransferase [Escherichia coli]
FQYHFAQFPKHPFYKNGINRTSWRAHPDTIIGSDVWIGAQSIVKAGVNIGHGAIIAANSVVTKNIAPYSIVGGSPAKVIRMRFNAEQISKLLELRWWELSLEEISDLEFGNIDSCIESLLKIRRIEHL